ncbi:hypothetical protein MBLNU457_6812t1 [Dothideomycetes sp. NU457]
MWSTIVIHLLVVSLTYFNLVTADLIINALTSDENGDSRFQCWQMLDPFEDRSAINDGGMNWEVSTIKPGERRELQKTTRPSLSFVLTGKCHVWLPDESAELWLGGADPVAMVVADVDSKGHYAWHHSIRSSLEVQFSFVDDIMPDHTVFYNGTCRARDLRSTSDPALHAFLRAQLEAKHHNLLGSMSNDVESYLHRPHPVEPPTVATKATTAATTAKASTVDAIWREVHFTEQAQQQPFV